MTGMAFDSDTGMGVWGSAAASTRQVRQMAANAVRLRLPYQLDFRLDAVLDPDGFHILTLTGEDEGGPIDYETAAEPFTRCRAMLKFVGVSDPFEMLLDLRFRDYLVLDPAGRGNVSDFAASTHATVQMSQMRPDEYTPAPAPRGRP